MKYLKLYEQFRLLLESETVDLKSLGFTDDDIKLIEEMKVDGNKLSMLGNIAKEVFNKENISISIVAVIKGKGHKPKAIIGEEDLVKKFKKEILLINNEAHRFAIAFHRQKRNVIL